MNRSTSTLIPFSGFSYAFIFSCLAFLGIFPSLASAAACVPPASGDYAVTADCAFSNTVDGVDNGNLTINAGVTLTLNAGQTLVINSGKSISVMGSIAINSTAQIRKTNLWMTDADVDGWPASVTEIAQDATPASARRRYLMASVAIADCNDAVYSLTNTCGVGGTGAWSAAANALPQGIEYHSAAVYNGFLYTTGGYDGTNITSAVYSAPINASGVVGSWTTNTALPQAIDLHSAVASNGFMYTIGGYDRNAANLTSTVYYAPINGGGALGAWSTTTPLPQPIDYSSAVVWNGFVYATGGSAPIGVSTSTVYYAPINGGGALGAWSTATPLPQAMSIHSAAVYNGFLYTTGGYNGATGISTVYYAPINANGSLGAWTATTPLPRTLYGHDVVAYNGFLYTTAGYDGATVTSTVYYAPINANGTVGSWATTAPLPQGLYLHSAAAYNGFLYTTGGRNSAGSPISTVYYAPVQ